MKKSHSFSEKALSVLLCTLMLFSLVVIGVPSVAKAAQPERLIQIPLDIGESCSLPLFELPEGVSESDIIWASSKTEVATVSNGVVTGEGYGVCNIKALTPDSTIAGLWVILVKPSRVFAITISAGNISTKQKPGATLQLYATVEPADPTVEFTWSSSNPQAATVDENGLVTYVAVGNAVIFAKGNNGNSFGEIYVETIPREKEDIKETYRVEMAAAGTYFIIATKVDGEYVETPYFKTMVLYVEEGDELIFRFTSSSFYPLVNGSMPRKDADGYYHIRNIDKDLAIIDNVLPIGTDLIDPDPNTNSAPSFLQKLQEFFKKLVAFFRAFFA